MVILLLLCNHMPYCEGAKFILRNLFATHFKSLTNVWQNLLSL